MNLKYTTVQVFMSFGFKSSLITGILDGVVWKIETIIV